MKQVLTENAHRTPYDDSYGSCERTYAALRIYADAVDPESITRQLDLVPTHKQKKGERNVNSLGRVRTAKINGWFLSSEGTVESLDLRRHLDWLLGRLEPSSRQLLDLQRTGDVTMLVNCVWWMAPDGLLGGPTLWPEQMGKLAALNLECGFEFASYGDDEEPAP